MKYTVNFRKWEKFMPYYELSQQEGYLNLFLNMLI